MTRYQSKLRLIALLSCLITCFAGYSQKDSSRITARFSGADISQLVKVIESQTGYYFYYDIRQLDSIQFNFSVKDATLTTVLAKAFANTKFNFAIDHQRHIFITRDVAIQTTPGPVAKQIIVRKVPGKINADTTGNVRSSVEAVQTLASVTVMAATNLKSTQMGVQKIDIKAIRQVPVVFGEADVLRVVMSLPGVKTVGEASTGLNVRGGSTDQNLILFNDATVYNPAHFFGMFSAFNPDLVKDVTLYKSSIPARYGGRLSSVLEITGKEGNKKNYTGSAGVGMLTSRIALEGPIIKDKTSFAFGARTTYANWLLKLLPDQYKDSKANFYDVNLNISHTAGKNSELFITGYLSHDNFNLNNDTTYGYDNKNVSVKWKQNVSKRINAVFTGGIDDYRYHINSKKNPVNAYDLNFRINQESLKAHFNYYATSQHTVDFGWNSIYYNIDPGTLSASGGESVVMYDKVQSEHALESAIYMNDKFDISNDLSLEGGVRYSMYNSIGPRKLNVYQSGQPKDEETIVDSVFYNKGKFIKTYGGPEYRLSVRYSFSEKYSIKASVNTLHQYIHMLSNTAAMAPTDTWKLSDPNIRPQQGTQYSFGLYRNFKSNTIETSLELYYKDIKDYLDYKSGANLIMNHHIETDVINTKGKAYGAEVLIKKATGKFNGWLSYTYSRILLRQNDPNAGEIINKGEFYPASYDKPHDFTVITNYRINQRFSMSMNANYSTGRPITVPIGRYYYANSYRTYYDKRNGHRIPDYFRMDFSMNIDGNHKVKQLTHNSWTIGVYNLTARRNPYSVYYVSENGSINGYRLSIFGSAIPFVTYNIRF
jgi:hypothetical protein